MAGYLERIERPEDLKRLGWQELQELAGELREEIIRVVAANGGHLAPNLGVVELTLALHRVFASPRDKIIWDVGHQCYTHKLITGRRELFPTLRRLGGLSGFPKPEESPHDAFATGHSSTAVSAALGMAIARDLAGEDYHVVAVVGDGAMTGGMAFEALNHAGHLKTRLIVVLNDNEMSIAPNVGALAAYLSRLRTDPKYYRGKEEIEQFLRRVPSIGPAVLKAAERLKDSLKYLVVPGMLFEELGFTYLGPIDGHNIREMVEVFTKARSLPEPVLVHVLTKKGKGYEPAEKDCDKFHGIGPFDIKTGQAQGRSAVPTYTEIFGRTVIKLAEADRRLVAITAAMPSGTGLKPFAGRFPTRFFDVGIAEQHAVTLAAGMAKAGLKPVVAIYSTFLQRAYDQIVHDVCLQCLPVIFAIDRAGLVGEDGPTHHGVLDIAYLRSIPNMIIMAPRNENELQHMLYTALHCEQPAAVRYPRSRGEGVPLDGELRFLTPGRAEVLREGRDLALLAVGTMVAVAEKVADELAREGIAAAVINARFIKPLDTGTILHYARQTGRIVTIEEHALAGGFGSAVLELLQEAGLEGVKVVRFGIPDRFIEHGKREELLELCGLTAGRIVQVLREELFARRRRFKAGLSAVRKVE